AAPAPRRPQRPRRARLGDPRRRLRAGMLIMAVLLSLFAGRLLQLQGLDPEAYAARAERTRLTTITLQATRGSITDREGVPLARTVAARAVTTDPKLVGDVGRTATRLAPLLGEDPDVLREKLSRTDRRYALLADGLTPQEGNAVEDLELEGVFVVDTLERDYAAGHVGANVVGFVNAEGKGAGGIEYALDDVLVGHDGRRTYERSASGRVIPTGRDAERAAVPGRDVRLTLDRDIQWAAQRALARQVRAADAQSGTVVVMDASTGKILALATAPTFDPNDPGASRADNRGNRAVSEVYEPGSTGKVMTAAAALESGKVTPMTEFTIPPVLQRGGGTFRDHTPHGTLRRTFAGVIAESSNIGTILAAERLGLKHLYPTFRDFGIAEPGGSGLPGASTGFLPEPAEWSATTPYTLAFGQGYSVNAVQMASVYATIANDGVRVQPSVVDGYVEPDGSYTAVAPRHRTRVVSEDTAQQVSRMLEMVVSDEGTAPGAVIPGYRVAGKTGTAERVDPRCGCYRGYTASFIGYAPADDDGLVTAVTLQDPKNGHYGGLLGGPVFTEVSSFALKAEGIAPTGTQAPRLRLDGR
ncbi:MAG: peptidoglycan D,D-transpeptidase FtsI family protein, partial [Actinomycetes bacterium]